MRQLKGWQRWILGGWLVAATLFHLYTGEEKEKNGV